MATSCDGRNDDCGSIESAAHRRDRSDHSVGAECRSPMSLPIAEPRSRFFDLRMAAPQAVDAYPGRLTLRPGMALYNFDTLLKGKGDENVLDNSHACGDLHRTRNQRLLAGRVLIPRNAVEASPSAYIASRRAWFVSLSADRALFGSSGRSRNGAVPFS